MYIYNKFSKLGLSVCLITSVGILGACDNNLNTGIKPDTLKNNSEQSKVSNNVDISKKNLLNNNSIDWTSGRVRLSGFSLKSASDTLKPQTSVDTDVFDNSLAINNPNTVLNGRVSTLTDSTNPNFVQGNQDKFTEQLKIGDKIQIISTGEIATVSYIYPLTKRAKVSGITFSLPVNTRFIIEPTTDTNTDAKSVTGYISTAIDSTSKTLDFVPDDKDAVIDITGKMTFLDAGGAKTANNVSLTDVTNVKGGFLSTTPLTKATTDSEYKIYISGNSRGKNFGSMGLYPAIDLNNAGNADDVLYYTSDNTTGSNFFAVSSDGNVKWEQTLGGNFEGTYPTFSKGANPKTYQGKKVMYLASKGGYIYCLNTDGKLVASIKIDDSFRNSVFVDSSDANIDYVYAASLNGNFYRLKIDFSNSQAQSFTSMYAVKLADTAFFSSPVLNGSSVYVGGENGTLYEVIPNTGDASRSWDLSAYSKNGSAKILGTPLFDNITNSMIVPAGGYLFRIVGSTVTQSPLLELKNGLNSRNKPYGAVLNTDSYPSGNISSWPVISPTGNMVYIANGDAIFESDISSVDSFKNSANYCVSMAGRMDNTDKNLAPGTNGVVALSTSSGNLRAAMVDSNFATNLHPFINYFSLPLSSSTDKLIKFMALNEFDSIGHSLKGINSSSIPDNSGNVYFTLDNGAVKLLPTP